MTTDSYTTVDRNKLLRRCEVIADTVIAMRDSMRAEGTKELLDKQKNILWYEWIICPIWCKRLKKLTAEALKDESLLSVMYAAIIKGYSWATCPWYRILDGEREVKQLMKQLRAESAQPTILLSTAHICALDSVETILKEKGWME